MNNNGINELAKLFKERNNPSIQGIAVGQVVAPPPAIKITVNGFVLEKANLVIAKHLLTNYTSSPASVGDHGEHTHTVADILAAGDKVIVMPTIDDATYFILGKVGDL